VCGLTFECRGGEAVPLARLVRRSRNEALGPTDGTKATKPRTCMGTKNGDCAVCQSACADQDGRQRALSAHPQRYSAATCTAARR
jgi:hypothetical protein